MNGPVLVFVDHDRGTLDETTTQAITFARATRPDAEVVAVVVGRDAARALASIATVTHVDHEMLDDYAPEAWGDALHQLAAQTDAAAVVATGTARGNEVLAHVAAIADEPFAANVVSAVPGDPWQIRRVRWGGSLLEDATLSAGLVILSCAPHAFPNPPPEERDSPIFSVTEFVPALGPTTARTRIVDRVQVAEGITLTTAPVVVSGGRGVGSEEGFAALESLAALLGAAVGCSRVVTNQGWRPHADQVGQTGKRVAPDLYIACGISGAIQHWVGMQAAKHILAINTDPDAPMVTKADYAVIGDLHEIVPAIVEELRRRRVTPTISCRGVWKVFGPHAERVVDSADADLPRVELEARTGCVAAVRAVSFDVPAGDVFVVMGLSGSGKSTLVRCISRLIEPTAGQVIIDGEDIANCSPEWLRELRRSRVSMVFQHFGLLPHRRVLDNVAFGLEVQGKSKAERHARAGDMLDLVGLSGLGESYPDELSGGMQQRVGLARALANDPEILLFDEPFSALDPLIRRDMQDEVARLQRELKKTVVFITHDLQEALKLGDRIAIMRDGRFVQVDSPEAVVARPVDDYVRDFVRDVPRSHVLTAGGIMTTALDSTLTNGTVAATASVSDLLPIVVATDQPIAVVDDAGNVCGAVDRLAVLSALAETE